MLPFLHNAVGADIIRPRGFRFQHRRGIVIPGPFGSTNRAASSKQARFIRHWRRFACFPHAPLKRPDQGACGPPILDYTPKFATRQR